MNNLIPSDRIESKILYIRKQKVMLDRDLAELYGVPTKVLNQAVKRNTERFPSDFAFSLSRQEIMRMSQFVTSSNTLKYSKKVTAFTENGVAMLSSILNSKQAIMVNIQIMRTFTKLRKLLSTNTELKRKIEEMEKKYDCQFKTVFSAIKLLIESPPSKNNKIGFV